MPSFRAHSVAWTTEPSQIQSVSWVYISKNSSQTFWPLKMGSPHFLQTSGTNVHTAPCPSFYHPCNVWWRVKLARHVIMQFSPVPCKAKISFSAPYSWTPPAKNIWKNFCTGQAMSSRYAGCHLTRQPSSTTPNMPPLWICNQHSPPVRTWTYNCFIFSILNCSISPCSMVHLSNFRSVNCSLS
jgi:hypothetical protein